MYIFCRYGYGLFGTVRCISFALSRNFCNTISVFYLQKNVNFILLYLPVLHFQRTAWILFCSYSTVWQACWSRILAIQLVSYVLYCSRLHRRISLCVLLRSDKLKKLVAAIMLYVTLLSKIPPKSQVRMTQQY